MFEESMRSPPVFKFIIVFSLSRYMRDEFLFEFYRRKLKKNGVEIISVTQSFGDDVAGDFMRRIFALFDEMNSCETAKHVSSIMIVNAKAGYWNGAPPIFGYKPVVVKINGQQEKNKLDINPIEACTVLLMFKLYYYGDGEVGPLGIRDVTRYLNYHEIKKRNGVFFYSDVAKILRNEAYIGKSYYNRFDSRTKTIRPESEWVPISLPPIIDEVLFQNVQARLRENSPAHSPPRMTNNSVLLSGIARCGACGSPLRIQYAKSGRYPYYRCGGVVRKGICSGGSKHGISAPYLDNLVLERVLSDLLTPERVQKIVMEVAIRHQNENETRTEALRKLEGEEKRVRSELTRLIKALASGIIEESETVKAILKEYESDLEQLIALIERQKKICFSQIKIISLSEANSAISMIKERFRAASPNLRKRLLKAFVSQVIVTDDSVMLTGTNVSVAETITQTLNG